MRLFIAAPVTLSGVFLEAAGNLQGMCPGIQAVPEGNWHVTLRFLGEVDNPRPVAAAMHHALRGVSAIPAVAQGVGAFPQPDAARVAWAAMAAPNLDRVVMRIRQATGNFGNRPETTGFVPHITLARLRPACNITDWIDRYRNTVFFQGTLGEIVLFSSRLMPRGPVYTAQSVKKLVCDPGVISSVAN